MPFLPFVLLLAWQALSKSASFALGWATALYFGQVPGRQGRILSVVSLLAAGWVIVVIGFAVPIFGGALLETIGVIDDNFDVEAIHYIGLVAAILLTPPAIAAATVYAKFHEDRSITTWARMLPISYPATAMLGASVLQMVVFTPILLFERWRKKRKLVQVPLVMADGSDDDDLVKALRAALGTLDIGDIEQAEARGPRSWPLRTLGFAAQHLLGAVVRGEPMRLQAAGLDIMAYATNVSILGPKEDAYRARAAIEREFAFQPTYLSWNEDAQHLEDALRNVHRSADGDVEVLRLKLDEIQDKIDTASLNTEEWNVLYRLRLQLEQDVARRESNRS
ncbi:MAG: hypothetical protein ABIW50_07680 [Candidatus Limnocylindria bacterium]